ncbi:MAG: DUF4339 domain-containing protein, partial [Bdellovibrionales bacterium]|nr:DUF4339 domain-containing protein [Bdellovibrionales bacterium]
QGKTIGPVDQQEMIMVIKSGKLGAFDLLYREGQEKWQPCHQFGEFNELFKTAAPVRFEDSWVVLIKKTSGDKINYLQKGPFSTAKVKELLQAGEIRYSEFIWKEGQKKWARISSLELFNPPPVQWQPAVVLPQDVEAKKTVPENLSEMVTQIRWVPSESKPEAIPAEATSIDLVTAKLNPEPTLTEQRKAADSRNIVVENKVTEQIPFIKPKSKWLEKFILILSIFAAILFFLYRQELVPLIQNKWAIIKPQRVNPPPKILSVPNPPPPQIQPAPLPNTNPVLLREPQQPLPAPPQPTPAKVEVPIPRVEPTFLNAKITSHSPKSVLFFTDGSPHFSIRVEIKGRAGEILDQVNYYKEIILRWKNNEKPRLDLESLNLPEGLYELHAKMGEFLAQPSSFRMGKEDKEFQTRLAQHRKFISLPFQRERRKLILASSELLQLGQKLVQNLNLEPGIWSQQYREWKKNVNEWNKYNMSILKTGSPKTLVFPDQWEDLKEQRKNIFEVANSFDKAKMQNQKIEAKISRDLIAKLQEILTQCQKLSLY